MVINRRSYKGKNNPFYGKHHSEKTKKQLSKAHKGKLLGDKNPAKRDDVKKKLSQKLKGRIFSEEHKRKLSESHKGLAPWNKGRKSKKLSRIMKNKWKDSEYYSQNVKVAMQNLELAHKAVRGKKLTESHKERIGEAHQKLWSDTNYAETQSIIVSERTKKQWKTPKFKQYMVSLWEDDEWKKKQRKKMLKGLMKRPTSLEIQFMAFCEKYDLPFKYVGDGDVLIGCRNPDFIHTEGVKLCVEVGSTWFHSKDYIEERESYFKDFGWDCVVFLTEDKQLNEAEIIESLKNVGVPLYGY